MLKRYLCLSLKLYRNDKIFRIFKYKDYKIFNLAKDFCGSKDPATGKPIPRNVISNHSCGLEGASAYPLPLPQCHNFQSCFQNLCRSL